MLSRAQVATLASGLHELDEEHSIMYVATTRAKRLCGTLAVAGTEEPDDVAIQLQLTM